jgi:hypothetical protein
MINGLYKYTSTYLFLLLCITSIACQDRKNNTKFYFCGKKIYDPDYLLSSSNISAICSRIGDDNRILIGIQRNIPLPHTNLSTEDLDNFYTRDTEELFLKQCGMIGPYTCDFGYLFTIYTDARKARLTAGRLSKNNLSNSYRTSIMNSVRTNMSYGQFPDAILKVVDQFRSILGGSYVNNYEQPRVVTPAPQPNTSHSSSQTYTYSNKSSGGSGWTILIFVLVFAVCVACCYMAYKRYESEMVNVQTTVNYNSGHVYHHLHKLEHLLKEVRNSTPPLVSINKCLLCMDKMQGCQNQGTYYEMNNFSTSRNNDMNTNLLQQQTNLTRFQCGHLYHTACLDAFGLGCCLMCEPDFNARVKTANLSNEHIVDEIQIRRFISNFNRIYGKEVVEEYVRAYPDDYSTTMAVVGLSSFAAGALIATAVMSDHHYGYGGGYNQYNTYNTYNNNPPNYDSGYAGNNYGGHGQGGDMDMGGGYNTGGVTGGDLDTAEVDF